MPTPTRPSMSADVLSRRFDQVRGMISGRPLACGRATGRFAATGVARWSFSSAVDSGVSVLLICEFLFHALQPTETTSQFPACYAVIILGAHRPPTLSAS